MKNTIVQVQHLSHKYTRDWAIRDIHFDIETTGVMGLLGSNGAGKSTTMSIMSGVLSQTEGSVLIDGIHLGKRPEEAKKMIGFLPQTPPLHLDLTVDEYLIHCAFMRKMDAGKIPDALAEVKSRCGIAHFSKRLIRNLSGGYRQRVGIAQAIIHKPKLVILDEPTNGLDPVQIYEMRNLIKEIGKDKAVIFSSHILSEVQATCQEVKMIEGGRMVFAGTMDAFNNYIMPDSLVVRFSRPPLASELAAIHGIRQVEAVDHDSMRIWFNGQPRNISETLVRLSVELGWQLWEIHLERYSLDEVFARLSKRGKA
ncbi:MAG: ABC transporter ATP-binding protein [Bacteroidota bacterium]|nr:ABC transporter ATP-binding protein [Bacteroidota bacterium]